MQDLETLHQEAMELVDQAILARQRSDAEAVLELSRAAFAKERVADDLVANQFLPVLSAQFYTAVQQCLRSRMLSCGMQNDCRASPHHRLMDERLQAILPMRLLTNFATCC